MRPHPHFLNTPLKACFTKLQAGGAPCPTPGNASLAKYWILRSERPNRSFSGDLFPFRRNSFGALVLTSMGLPLYKNMDNLHAPTIPSGPTSAPATNGHAHQTFPELQRKKQNLEEELKALSGVLDSVRLHTILRVDTAYQD